MRMQMPESDHLALNRQPAAERNLDLRIGQLRQVLRNFRQDDGADLFAHGGADDAKGFRRGSYNKPVVLVVRKTPVEVGRKRLRETVFFAPVEVVALNGMACNICGFVNAAWTLRAYLVIGSNILPLLRTRHFA